MSILCTFPGKFGDILWALPTVRALARRTGEAIDLMVAGDMVSVCPLISAQPYVGACFADGDWIRLHADSQDRLPPRQSLPGYAHTFHLGYTGWPQRALPFETLDTFNGHKTDLVDPLLVEELDLNDPWIRPLESFPAIDIAFGWSDDHFELKAGLSHLLTTRTRQRTRMDDSPGVFFNDPLAACSYQFCQGPNMRWQAEAGMGWSNWKQQAAVYFHSRVVLACNSALHVLAVAVGTPVVMMEPSEARWNPIFYPLGKVGPQVTLVTGNDGRPTFDARHVADTLTSVLERSRHATRSRQTPPAGQGLRVPEVG